MPAADPLSLVFSALADPTRREILVRLGEGDATVTQLAEPFPISVPAISRHLKVLETAGLITRGRQAQWRTSALRTEPLEGATDWMAQVTALWNGRLDRLDEHLELMKRQLLEQATAGLTDPSAEAPRADPPPADPPAADPPAADPPAADRPSTDTTTPQSRKDDPDA